MKCEDCGGRERRATATRLVPYISLTCTHCDGKGTVPAEVDPWPDNALEGGVFHSSDNRASET